MSQIALPGIYDTTGSISWVVRLDSNGCRGPLAPDCQPNSVEDYQASKKDLRVYPNPTSSGVNIECSRRAQVRVYSLSGKLLKTQGWKRQKVSLIFKEWQTGFTCCI